VPRKPPPLEEQLARLAELRSGAPSPEACAELAGYLNSKSNLVVAKAARIAAEWKSDALAPELVAAFERFLVKPETTDKQCVAKMEILKALYKLEHSSPSVFRRGIRHVQMEANWGKRVDTAAEVRALSAIGLAQTGDPQALEEILPVMVDAERGARIGAVRAIGASGRPGDVLLLRFKALIGDEPGVMGECLAALLRAAPAESVEFVGKFLLHADEAVAEAAALALGDSRLESAFAVLREAYPATTSRALRRTLLLAIALLRRESALDYLLDLARNAEAAASADAVAALAMYEQDPKLQERLRSALDGRAAGFTTPSDKGSGR
jgi:HEAT repeat protein